MPQPILFRLTDQRSPRSRLWYGTSPLTPFIPPSFGQSLLISGITKDSGGNVLGACAVTLYRTSDDVVRGRAISDATTGAYSFSAGMGQTYYVVAYKVGAPDVAGTTVNTLVVSTGQVAVPPPAYATLLASYSPTNWLRVDDPSGTVATASAGSNGAYVNTPTLGAASLLANDADAAVTLASTQRVTIPSVAMGTGPETWLVWFKRNETAHLDRGVFGFGSGGTQRLVLIHGSTGLIDWTVGTSGGAFSAATHWDTNPTFLVVTYDGSGLSSGYKVYVNGVDDTSGPVAGTVSSATGTATFGVDNSGDDFLGTLDELAIWTSVALTSAQVLALYHAAGY